MVVQNSKYGFSHLGCRDKLAKLKRELTRMKRMRHNADYLTDHTENFCYAAWHLTEWIWGAYFKQDGNIWGDFCCHLLSVDENLKGVGQYRDYLERSCEELAYCRAVATGAKHFDYESSNPAVVSTGMDVTIFAPIIIELDLFTKGGRQFTTSLQRNSLYTPRLHLPDGQRIDASVAFPKVLKFLTKFLDQVEAAYDDND